jgi:uncharacterized protein
VSSGLIALLDDVAAIAKLAAASLDDAAAQASKAGAKAAGIVIDDAAVTPRYVVGLAASRELPIIAKIAWGSLKNKMLFILPAALLLNIVAPWVIMPLLMAGGAYLCLEGFHKVMDLVKPSEGSHGLSGDTDGDGDQDLTPEQIEDLRVGSAIRTDFILSAEIMAITLAAVATQPLLMEAVVLSVVGIGMTVLVYGAVAIIVKADDVGVAMARKTNALVAATGRGIVVGMPVFLKWLAFIGMVAMLWVGGGIVVHGLHVLGWHLPEDAIKGFARSIGATVPAMGGFLEWFVDTGIKAVIGLVIGAVVDPLATHALKPLARSLKGLAAKKA